MSFQDEWNDPTVFDDWSRPFERSLAELHCLARTIMPSDQTKTRAALTLLLFVVWSIVTLGIELDHAIVTLQYGAGSYIQHLLTALVFLVIGRMWGIEVDGLIQGLSSGGNTDDRNADRGYHSPGELEDATDDYPHDE